MGGPGGGFFSTGSSSGLPLLLSVLKPPPGPPKPLPKLVRVENLTRTISEDLFNEAQGLYAHIEVLVTFLLVNIFGF